MIHWFDGVNDKTNDKMNIQSNVRLYEYVRTRLR